MTGTLSDTLTAAEAASLAECEDVISRGMQTFTDVGNALAEVRESRLYRASHGNFDDYCADRWGFTKRHAGRFIQSAAVMEMVMGPMGPAASVDPPTNERQVRPMTRMLPPPGAAEDVVAAQRQEMQKTWTEAVATAPVDRAGKPKVTARHVAATVARRRPAAVAESAPDAKGRTVAAIEQPAAKRSPLIEKLAAQRQALDSAELVLAGTARALEKLGPLHPGLTAEETAHWLSGLNGARKTFTVLARRLKEYTDAAV